MQVGTGKSILNGIAIGKLKIYKKKDTVISAAEVADTAAEVARFEDARAKAMNLVHQVVPAAELVRDLVKARFGMDSFLINYVGPTIGSHSGPGTLALFFMGEER